MSREISNSDDLIDSRDVIERIDELEAMDEREDWEEDELTALRALAAEGQDYAADWKYGAALIRDSYFEDYAQQTAEDLGAISRDAAWPLNHIDWNAAAEELKIDYSSISFDGVDYWVRA